jgi:fructokinase
MEAAPQALKVLDLNLRQPFVDAQIVRDSLETADVLKLNKTELASLPSLLGEAAGAGLPRRLIERFGLVRIYITLGAAGCAVHDDAGNLIEEAPAVSVVDAVGAGDAFTAVMVDGELRGLALVEIARRASAAGAFVASQRGAMAPWPDRLKRELGI